MRCSGSGGVCWAVSEKWPELTRAAHRGEGDLGARAGVPLQLLEKTMVEKAFLCSLWRTTVEQISIQQPLEDPTPEPVDVH